MFSDCEEMSVGVMPSVTRLIVRRRRKTAIRFTSPPVRLAFKISTMTCDAISLINTVPHGHLLLVTRIGAANWRRKEEPRCRTDYNRCKNRYDQNGATVPVPRRRRRVHSTA